MKFSTPKIHMNFLSYFFMKTNNNQQQASREQAPISIEQARQIEEDLATMGITNNIFVRTGEKKLTTTKVKPN